MPPKIAVQGVGMPGAYPEAMPPGRVGLLPGAIDGVETNYYVQSGGSRHVVPPWPGRGQVFLFTAGAGDVRVRDETFRFSGIAAICAPGNLPLLIEATSAWLEFLEIVMVLRDDEVARLRRRDPFFVRYAECQAYAEAIKSPRTLSRTIVPDGTVPRFCMGSVEAVGPDEVGAHSHPMLEQLFFGLPGNLCVVTADEAVATLEARALLHIPLGSRHGVRVSEGHRMHYIWMDFFRSEGDMAYIQAQHKPIEK